MPAIRDASLAPLGRQRIQWVQDFMPVLSGIREDFEREQPFQGLRIAVSVHMEAKTAYLTLVLRAGGAQVRATGSNPLSTKDDVCAALAAEGVEVFGWFGATEAEYREHLRQTVEFCPHIVIDDGGDLVNMLLGDYRAYARELIGGCEETTTGVHRLRALAREGRLPFPMLDVNDADSKHLFDNRYGTGQSVWDLSLIHI